MRLGYSRHKENIFRSLRGKSFGKFAGKKNAAEKYGRKLKAFSVLRAYCPTTTRKPVP